MSKSKRTDSDRALARLLSDALRNPADAASGLACPDAEVLAAYAERNLDASETARWEQHFAECGRCQKILAVLTVSGEEPLTGAELQRFGRQVAAAELGVPVAARREAGKETGKKITPFERPRTAWRWLAPAAGIAAALALWIALRPVPRPDSAVLTAQNAASEPAPPPGESLEAQASVPAPPAVAERPEQKQQGQQQARQQQSGSPEFAPSLKKEASPAAKTSPAPELLPARSSAEAPSSQVQPLLQAANEAAENPAGAKQGETAAAASPAPPAARAAQPTTGAASAVPPPVPATPAGAQASSGTNETAEAKPAANRPVQLFAARQAVGGVAGADTLVRPAAVIASPGGGVLWRLGPGGKIERSTDRGQSWQPQTSGVTSELSAGAAPSDAVAWIVGRAGVILRTIDGEHWQRVTSPDAAADWAGVQATDALHATIASSNRRRYVTDDAGQTWKQQ